MAVTLDGRIKMRRRPQGAIALTLLSLVILSPLACAIQGKDPATASDAVVSDAVVSDAVISEEAPVPSNPASADSTLTTRRFSITYPQHWVVVDSSDTGLILMNQPPPAIGGAPAPPFLIKTDVAFVPLPLEAVVPVTEAGVQPSEFDHDLITYRRVERRVVDGVSIVQIWAESRGDFPNSITTYIAASPTETAYVVSFYNAENSFAEDAILPIQASFRLINP